MTISSPLYPDTGYVPFGGRIDPMVFPSLGLEIKTGVEMMHPALSVISGKREIQVQGGREQALMLGPGDPGDRRA